MATTATTLTGRNLADLKTNVDAFFAANLDIRVLHVEFTARESVGLLGEELSVTIAYDTDGTAMATPYIANFQEAAGASQLGTAIATFLGTVTTQFSAGPYVDFQGNRRRADFYTSMVITNATLADGQTNWLASPSQTGVSPWRLNPLDATAYSTGPAAGTINGAAAPADGYQLVVNTLDFDAATDEGCYWIYPLLPDFYRSSGALLLNFRWTATATTNDVVWRATAAGIETGEVITAQTHGTFVTTTETAPGAADTVLGASIALTAAEADTLQKADYLQFLFGREGSAAGDNMTGDARFIGGEVLFL